MPCVRWPPWSRESPSSVSPGRAIACSTAAFAVAPECGWTFANSAAEQRLGPLDRELFGDVDLFAAAVVAATGVALGVLVREHRALRLQDRDGHEVLGRDHLEVSALALQLAVEHLRDLGVDLGEGGVEVLIGHGDLLDDGSVRFGRPRCGRAESVSHRPRRAVECRCRSLPGGDPPQRQSRPVEHIGHRADRLAGYLLGLFACRSLERIDRRTESPPTRSGEAVPLPSVVPAPASIGHPPEPPSY